MFFNFLNVRQEVIFLLILIIFLTILKINFLGLISKWQKSFEVTKLISKLVDYFLVKIFHRVIKVGFSNKNFDPKIFEERIMNLENKLDTLSKAGQSLEGLVLSELQQKPSFFSSKPQRRKAKTNSKPKKRTRKK